MKYIYDVLLIISSVLLFSCQNTSEEEVSFTKKNVGGLRLTSLDINTIDIPVVSTKAADFSMLDKENFILKFYKEDGSEYTGGVEDVNSSGKPTISYSGKTLKELKELGMPLLFPVGTYKVEAFSYKKENILENKPYFWGEKDFTIDEHQVRDATIECKFKSIGVEIVLHNDFLYFFDDSYKITVSNGLGTEFTFDKGNQNIRYFTEEDIPYLKLQVECRTKDNLVYPVRSYYLNKDGKEPVFNGDSPYLGEHFIITIGEKDIKVRSLN